MRKNNENICFVMMPFGDPFDSYYDKIYKPAIESLNFTVKRADSLFRPSPIIKDIWEYINNSKILVADITQLNANVMYELGLSHAIAKPVIIISDTIENVPFDLRFLRILIYDTKKPDWSEDLRNKIINSITEILESPTDSILPVFMNIKPQIVETDQISAELIEIKQLIMSQINNTPEPKTKRKITASLLIEASKDVNRLYFDEGWDMNDIKNFLIDNYGFSSYTADDVLHRAI